MARQKNHKGKKGQKNGKQYGSKRSPLSTITNSRSSLRHISHTLHDRDDAASHDEFRANQRNIHWSMRDEARNTGHHKSDKVPDKVQPLRYSAVNFVSAGKFDPSKEVDINRHSQDTEPPINQYNTTGQENGETDQEILDTRYSRPTKISAELLQTSMPPRSSGEFGFFVDTRGDATFVVPETNIGIATIMRCTPSPLSTSSSEEVVFIPKRQRVSDSTKAYFQANVNGNQSSTIRDVIDRNEELLQVTELTALNETQHAWNHRIEFSFPVIESQSLGKKRGGRHRALSSSANAHDNDNDDEDAEADFLDNLREHDLEHDLEKFNFRDLGGDDTLDESNNEVYTAFYHENNQDDSPIILDKREGVNGVQYLVKWFGTDMDHAVWVEADTVDGSASIFENDQSSSAPSAQFKGVDTKCANSECEKDFALDHPDSDADLNLARSLQNEEDEMLATYVGPLPSGESGGGGEFDDDDLVDLSTGKKGPNSKFTPASKLADAYDCFDVMDRSRTSLSSKPKRRNGGTLMSFGLSDPEQEYNLLELLNKDKLAKRKKRAERERLRNEGRLPSQLKTDLKLKYANGMTFNDVRLELKTFLLSDTENLILVPMEKQDRKQVHNLAMKFFLKSKSMGNGNNRYPVLYKTGRTEYFAENEDAINKVFEGRHFGRLKTGLSRPTKGSSTARKANTGHRHYDGDLVGIGAAELGQENRGRLMLEKMGWSTGTPLGAEGNKGILAPVQAIVKTTRTGLG